MVHLGNDWDEILAGEFEQDYYKRIRYWLKKEYAEQTIYPAAENIFNALRYTPYSKVKAVILGQDPYHGPGQAHGLCFSVPDGVPKPPSLVNIFKELNDDTGIAIPQSGNLVRWAKNGVLLLNSVLTVRAGQAGSHANRGWEIFTDRVISMLGERKEPIVFMLWGSYARRKADLITSRSHLILEAAHPSPLSAYNGFFGCRHFSRANQFLGGVPDWRLSD